MDAFEEIIAGLFRRQGYWTWQGYKINLSKEQKRNLSNPSMPRPEIDILAYKPRTNDLLWIECKSYLDSKGVTYDSFFPPDGVQSRFKIFTNDSYRDTASNQLKLQLFEEGLVIDEPSLQFGLVAANIYGLSEQDLRTHFNQKGWLLFDPRWIKKQLQSLSKLGYENDVAIIVAKLFERTIEDAN